MWTLAERPPVSESLTMEDSDPYLSRDQVTSLNTADTISASLSLLGCSSILISAVVKRKICNIYVWPLFQLSLADFLASACLLASSIIHRQQDSTIPQRSVWFSCVYLNCVTAGLYVITFFLTSAYAIQVHQTVLRQFHGYIVTDEQRHKRFLCSYLIYTMAWAIPAAGVASMLGVYASSLQLRVEEQFKQTDFCNSTCIPFFSIANNRECGPRYSGMSAWMKAYRWVFLGPLLFSLIIIMVMYISACCGMPRMQRRRGVVSHREYKELHHLYRQGFLFITVFLICWLPTMLLGLIASANDNISMARFFPLYMSQAVLSPLQGLFNALVYGWQRDSFKNILCPPKEETSNNGRTRSVRLIQ